MDDNLDENKKEEKQSSEIFALKDSIAEKQEIISQIKLESEKGQSNLNIDNSNLNFNREDDNVLNSQIDKIQNNISKIKNEKDELLKQNNNLKNELKIKENYILSINATILRLKNNLEQFNKTKNKYEL